MLQIEFQSEEFQVGASVTNGCGTLDTNWDDILWAALTVGRPNRQYVFQHGQASMFEAFFRLSLVRMSLEQSGPTGRRLRRTDAAKTLDPSEKGAVSYFLGMNLCKLFAAKLLDTPWLLHLDVFRPDLDIQLRGRSRPDMVGELRSGGWLAMESKGRVSPPTADDKDKAKLQATRCVRKDGVPPTYQIGCITYFKSDDVLRFFWRDPLPQGEPENPIPFAFDQSLWEHYYRPVLELVRPNLDQFKQSLSEPTLASFPQLDVQVGISPEVLRMLLESQWGNAKAWCIENFERLHESGYRPDGIRVVAGNSWMLPFRDNGRRDRQH